MSKSIFFSIALLFFLSSFRVHAMESESMSELIASSKTSIDELQKKFNDIEARYFIISKELAEFLNNWSLMTEHAKRKSLNLLASLTKKALQLKKNIVELESEMKTISELKNKHEALIDFRNNLTKLLSRTRLE